MNRKLGIISSAAVMVSTIGFAVSMLIHNTNMSYATSLGIAFSYVLMACAFASQTLPDKRAVSLGGIVFACMYAVFVSLVYFTQLTAVLNHTEVPDVTAAITYTPGSWFFALDLFGYALMAISTLLIGLAFTPHTKVDSILRVLLMLHGVFAPSCLLMPILNLFQRSGEQASGRMSGGTIALIFWCIYFTPLALLALIHFLKRADNHAL